MTVYQKPKHKYLVACSGNQDEINKVEKKKEFDRSYPKMVISICKLSFLAEVKNLYHNLTLLFI